MSATAARPGGTVTMTLPVQIIPGPHGIDSPVAAVMPRWRWYSWIDLDGDRRAHRPSPRAVIEWALGHPIGTSWPSWWLAPAHGEWQVHLAQVADVTDGGQMLLAACLLSAPWTGPNDDVVPRTDHDLTDLVPVCQMCPVFAS